MSESVCPTCGTSALQVLGGCLGCAARKPSDDARPLQIGCYPVLREIGAGGMGTVYLARQHCPPREVALKVISDGVFADAELRAKFLREREIAGSFEHPNIIRVYDAGEDADGQLYYVMEYAPRGTLRELMQTTRFTTQAALRLCIEVALAVDYAHRRRVLHRDLKPGNILIGDDLRPRVTDFGVAKMLESPAAMSGSDAGTLVGSWPYMSPEQAGESECGEVGVASDIYSLGAILYELLTGRHPYPANDREELLRALAHGTPPALRGRRRDVSYDLEAVVLKALARDPRQRYATAAAFAEDLRDVLGRRKPCARPRSFIGRTRSAAARHTAAFSIGLTALLFTGTGVLSVNQMMLRESARQNQELKQQTKHTANDIERHLHALMPLAEQLAGDPRSVETLQRSEVAHAATWIAEYRHKDPRINSVFLLTTTGRALAHAPLEPPSYYERRFDHRIYFRSADLAATQGLGSRVFVSPLFRSMAHDGLMKLALSTPVRDMAGDVIGVAVATVTLRELGESMRAQALTLVAPQETNDQSSASSVKPVEVTFDGRPTPRLRSLPEAPSQLWVAKVADTGYAVVARTPPINELHQGVLLWLLAAAALFAVGMLLVRREALRAERA